MFLIKTNKSKAHRQRVIFSIAILIIILLFIKFFEITVLRQEEFKEASLANSLRDIYSNAPRGMIYDRNSTPIVDNRPTYDLKFTPVDITDDFNYKLLSKLANINKDSLKNKIDKNRNNFKKFTPVLLKRHVQFKDMSKIQEYKLDFPGLLFSEFPARAYPNNAKATHILGYLRAISDDINIFNKNNNCDIKYRRGDVHGYTGIEKIYECDLKGEDGISYYLYDVRGLNLGLYNSEENISTVNGKDLFLTIDIKLQEYAESFMNDSTKGSIILMDPSSGDILTMVSYPEYNLQSFTGPIPVGLWNEWNSDSIGFPLMNRAIQGTYPPGSVLKLVTAAYALDNNIVNKNYKVDCKGTYSFYDETYSCWNTSGHGPMNLTESIRHSCNIYYFDLIKDIRIDDWANIIKAFGFGKKTNIDLPAEVSARIPDRKYMNNRYGKSGQNGGWSQGYLMNFVIGQGDVTATPLQVIQMTNLFATNGNTFEPHLKLGKDKSPVNVELKEETWSVINKAMWEVVNHSSGTGWRAKNKNFNVWGKTGTSQNPHGEDHSWFTGYARLESNDLVSAVVIIEQGGKGSGKSTMIAGKLFDYYNDLNNNENN